MRTSAIPLLNPSGAKVLFWFLPSRVRDLSRDHVRESGDERGESVVGFEVVVVKVSQARVIAVETAANARACYENQASGAPWSCHRARWPPLVGRIGSTPRRRQPFGAFPPEICLIDLVTALSSFLRSSC